MIKAGFSKPDDLAGMKATAIQQKLNGYRKKNKLNIPAVQVEEIEQWQGKI